MNRRGFVLTLGASFVLMTSCLGGAGVNANLTGSVVVGPMCPIGNCPDKAAPSVQVIFSDSGHQARTATTDANGHFSIGLPAGSYSIRLHGVNPNLPQFGSTDLHAMVGPNEITARPGDHIDLKFRIFSGIA